MIRKHLVAQGDAASDDLARGTMLRFANGFVAG